MSDIHDGYIATNPYDTLIMCHDLHYFSMNWM